MLKIQFYDTADEHPIKYAVMVTRYAGKWVFCKQKQRNTYEVPGGHIEAGETPLTAAKRELFEETGAVEFTIRPVCVYSVQGSDGRIDDRAETFGALFFAEVSRFGPLPEYEMEQIAFFSDLPDSLTYPLIQPVLMEKVKSFLEE